MTIQSNDFEKTKKADVVVMLIEAQQEIQLNRKHAAEASLLMNKTNKKCLEQSRVIKMLEEQINNITVVASGIVKVNYPDFFVDPHIVDEYGHGVVLNSETIEPPVGAKALNHIIDMCG